MARLLAWLTGVVPRRWRLRLVVFLVRMCRRNARLRLTPPLPWTRKRLAALLLVFIFGMLTAPYSSVMTPGGRAKRRFKPRYHLLSNPAQAGTLPLMNRLLLRRQHHDHLPPLQLGPLLYDPVGVEVRSYTLQQLDAELLVRHLAPAETQRNFSLIALGEKSDQVAQLDLIVALIRTGPELDFLDLDLPLL